MAAIGIKLAHKRIGTERRHHQQRTAIAVLDIGGTHDGMHREPHSIDENVPLLALDPRLRGDRFFLPGGIGGSTIAHSAPVGSLG